MRYREFILETLRRASEIAKSNYGQVESKVKSAENMQILTETDLKVGEFIIERIASRYPEHNIIDEEARTVDNHSAYTWTIDPVDGTSNYASKIPMYGIMLGLLKADEPIAGGRILPSFGEIYYAEKGAGAFCNDEKILVSENPDLSRNFLAYLISSHSDLEIIIEDVEFLKKLVPMVMSFRTSNCSAFDGAMVASGRYGVALNRACYIWDCVPLQIIVEEAGGIFTDFRGGRIDYSHSASKRSKMSFCTGPKDLHRQVQALIRDN